MITLISGTDSENQDQKANIDYWQDIMHANRALSDQKGTQLNKVDGIIEDSISVLEKDSRILQKGRAK